MQWCELWEYHKGTEAEVANRFNVKWLGFIILWLCGLALPSPLQAQSTPTPSAVPASYLGAVTNATATGAFVSQVVPASPADMAGLIAGDVIESVNGVSVTLDMPLNTLLKNYSPGANIQLIVGRANSTAGWLPIRVTLGMRQTGVPPIASATSALAAGPTAIPGISANAGFLGIGLINNGTGLQIAKVADGSPAAQAGIQVGDLLISLDGQPMTTVQQVQMALSAKTPGTRVSVVLNRSNQAITVTATLIAVPGTSATPTLAVTTTGSSSSAQSDIAPTNPSGATVHLGVTYDVLTPTLAAAKQLSVTDGALIVTVEPGRPAATAGLQIGDIVTAVDGDKVDLKHTLAIRLVAYNAGDTFKLTVVRGTQNITLSVTLAARGAA